MFLFYKVLYIFWNDQIFNLRCLSSRNINPNVALLADNDKNQNVSIEHYVVFKVPIKNQTKINTSKFNFDIKK